MSDVYFIVETMKNGKSEQLFPLYKGKDEGFADFERLFEAKSIEEVKDHDHSYVIAFMASMYFMACGRFDSIFKRAGYKDEPYNEILVTALDEKTNRCLWGFTICVDGVTPIYKFIDWIEKNIIYEMGVTHIYDYLNSK